MTPKTTVETLFQQLRESQSRTEVARTQLTALGHEVHQYRARDRENLSESVQLYNQINDTEPSYLLQQLNEAQARILQLEEQAAWRYEQHILRNQATIATDHNQQTHDDFICHAEHNFALQEQAEGDCKKFVHTQEPKQKIRGLEEEVQRNRKAAGRLAIVETAYNTLQATRQNDQQTIQTLRRKNHDPRPQLEKRYQEAIAKHEKQKQTAAKQISNLQEGLQKCHEQDEALRQQVMHRVNGGFKPAHVGSCQVGEAQQAENENGEARGRSPDPWVILEQRANAVRGGLRTPSRGSSVSSDLRRAAEEVEERRGSEWVHDAIQRHFAKMAGKAGGSDAGGSYKPLGEFSQPSNVGISSRCSSWDGENGEGSLGREGRDPCFNYSGIGLTPSRDSPRPSNCNRPLQKSSSDSYESRDGAEVARLGTRVRDLEVHAGRLMVTIDNLVVERDRFRQKVEQFEGDMDAVRAQLDMAKNEIHGLWEGRDRLQNMVVNAREDSRQMEVQRDRAIGERDRLRVDVDRLEEKNQTAAEEAGRRLVEVRNDRQQAWDEVRELENQILDVEVRRVRVVNDLVSVREELRNYKEERGDLEYVEGGVGGRAPFPGDDINAGGDARDDHEKYAEQANGNVHNQLNNPQPQRPPWPELQISTFPTLAVLPPIAPATLALAAGVRSSTRLRVAPDRHDPECIRYKNKQRPRKKKRIARKKS
ncbi:hypothetical protein BGZ60DRAFT_517378 [Tricladium varicosporioides]|nr:hypothetical protein BGZ60DRAFT_517378 [Hymenoscyphus varicosporioides]